MPADTAPSGDRRTGRAAAPAHLQQLRLAAGGACTDGDPTVFFHPEGERGPARRLRDLKAVAVCTGCLPLEACQRHALTAREPYGVWGGMTESQRQLVQSRRQIPFGERDDVGRGVAAGS